MSTMYGNIFAAPRFARSGAGARGYSNPGIEESSTAHEYGMMLSMTTSFVFGVAASRSRWRILPAYLSDQSWTICLRRNTLVSLLG